MLLALAMLVPELAFDAKQHPGGQPRVTPHQACTTSGAPPVTLMIEQVNEARSALAVRISARNQTPQTLAFVRSASTADLSSVIVLGPTGGPAKVKKGQGGCIGRCTTSHAIVSGPQLLPLPPQEDVTLRIWRVADDFDISAPGTYHISLGGRITFLDTTVCSNTAEVKVGN